MQGQDGVAMRTVSSSKPVSSRPSLRNYIYMNPSTKIFEKEKLRQFARAFRKSLVLQTKGTSQVPIFKKV